MKLKNFTCPCGNTNPDKADFYDGSMGYEAIICTVCGAYSDHEGDHKPTAWSLTYVRHQPDTK